MNTTIENTNSFAMTMMAEDLQTMVDTWPSLPPLLQGLLEIVKNYQEADQ